jgi:hypothetical protein
VSADVLFTFYYNMLVACCHWCCCYSVAGVPCCVVGALLGWPGVLIAWLPPFERKSVRGGIQTEELRCTRLKPRGKQKQRRSSHSAC